MKIKSLFIMLFLFAAFSSNAQNDQLKQQFEKELKTKSADVNSIKCNFTQTREIAVLANAVNKDGIFYFLKPANMLLSFADGDYIKMTEDWFEINMGGNVNSTKVSSNPMLKNLSSILAACVVGDFGKMTSGFAVNVEPTQSEWRVTMTPQRGKAASRISGIILGFDKDNMSLNTLKMEEKSGDYTLYRFFDKQFNIQVDTQKFNFSK